MQTSSSGGQVRALLILVALLIGVISGLAAGILSRIDGNSLPTAFLCGGGAFAGGVALVIAIVGLWDGR